jgi:broad specificity phosphatase PhoE
MGTLLLIRHGQASYGQADYDRLSPRGEAQARALGELLAAHPPDALYVGPLRRQTQTAAFAATGAAATGRGLPAATELAELAEYPGFDMVARFMPRLVAEDPRFAALAEPGADRSLAGTAFDTILSRWSRDEWIEDGVERVGAFTARVRAGLDHIVQSARAGERVAIVTSAGPIGVAVGLVFGASDHHMVRTSVVVRNASITELVFRSREFAWHPDRVSLLSFNSIHHLPADLHTDY